MIKKLQVIGIIASVFFICANVTSALADGVNPKYSPKDIQNHWAYTQLKDLVHSDVLNGYPDNTIHPDSTITRAEFVQMLVNAVGEQQLEAAYQQDRAFVDVQPDNWYYHAIHLLASIGFVDGVDPNHFMPNRNVQRDEMAKMIFNVFQVTDGTYPPLTKHFTDIPDDYWAKGFIDRLAKASLIDGYADGSFKPTANATRAEAATMIYNALHKQEGAPADDVFTNVVLDYEKKSIQLVQSTGFNALEPLYQQYTTGYYKASEEASNEKFASAINQGFTIQIALKNDPTAKVLDKSALSATVQLNEDAELTLKKDTFSQTTDMATSEILHLRRMPDNSWKIYDREPSNPSSNK